MGRRNSRTPQLETQKPAEERIWDAMFLLYPRYGVHLPIEFIAEAARTNTDTVLRHFGSRQEVLVAYLRRLVTSKDQFWRVLEEEMPKDPAAQLWAWLESAQPTQRDDQEGDNELSIAAASLRDPAHPGRQLIRKYKTQKRDALVRACGAAGYRDPEALGDKLFMLVEGARAAADCIGYTPAEQFLAAAQNLIAAHAPPTPGS